MMNKALVLMVCGILVACGGVKEKIVTRTLNHVVIPPEKLFECPTGYHVPPTEPTQQDAARVIVDLHRNNQICKSNIDQIKEFLERSKTITERDNP